MSVPTVRVAVFVTMERGLKSYDELAELFPQARILRMDVDTTRKKGSHQALLDPVWTGEADILLGTQMIAKGLDFPM